MIVESATRLGWRDWFMRRPSLGIALLLSALQSLENLILGPRSWIYGYGGYLETIPAQLAVVKSGSYFSSWAPSVLGGVDRLSFWGTVDPLNLDMLMYRVLPVWLASGILVWIQRFFSAYFTALVCEEQLGMTRKAGALTGLFHAAFYFYTVGELLSLTAGVPFLLWLFGRIRNSRSALRWTVVSAVGFSFFTVFGGSMPYLMTILVGWFVIVHRERSIRFFSCVAVFTLVVGICDAPQLVAQLCNAPLAHRSRWPGRAMDWSPMGLVSYQNGSDYFNQDKLVGGVVTWLPIALIPIFCFAAYKRRAQGQLERIYLRIGLFYLLLSLKGLFLFLRSAVALVLPWIGTVDMGRFHATGAPFLVGILLGIGTLAVAPKLVPSSRARRVGAIAMGALLGFLLIWPKISLFYPLMVDGWGEKHYQVRALDRLREMDPEPFRVASVMELHPTFAYGQGLETADGWSNLYPRVYSELWVRVLDPLFRKLPRNRQFLDLAEGAHWEHYVFLGSTLIVPDLGLPPGDDPRKVLEEGFDIDDRFNLHLLSLLNVKYLLSEYPLRGSSLRLVHAPESPPTHPVSRDFATGFVNSPRPGHEKISQLSYWPGLRRFRMDVRDAVKRQNRGKDVYIYGNTLALPRYRFVRRVAIAESGEKVLDALSSSTTDHMRDTAYIETADAPRLGSKREFSMGVVRLAEYTPDRISLDLESPNDGFLVIANTWNPMWRAEFDGIEAPLIRTNHAQFGLRVPVGARRVTLQYRPPYHHTRPGGQLMYACMALTGLIALVSFVTLVLRWRGRSSSGS